MVVLCGPTAWSAGNGMSGNDGSEENAAIHGWRPLYTLRWCGRRYAIGYQHGCCQFRWLAWATRNSAPHEAGASSDVMGRSWENPTVAGRQAIQIGDIPTHNIIQAWRLRLVIQSVRLAENNKSHRTWTIISHPLCLLCRTTEINHRIIRSSP